MAHGNRIPEAERQVMRVRKVLKRLYDDQVWRQGQYAQKLAEILTDPLEEMLNKIQAETRIFGNQGSCDPRGNFEEANWRMRNHIQGVDK
jgi:hypothetical protein